MKACSNSSFTSSSRARRLGSLAACSREPARSSSQFGPPPQVEALAGDLRLRPRRRLAVCRRRRDQVLVVVGPGLVVVVDARQVGVPEDVGQLVQLAAGAQLEAALAVELPAPAPLALVLVVARVAAAGLGLDVVEPGVLHAAPVGPDVLAGDRAGVTADALVEVHHHPHLGTDAHQYSTSVRALADDDHLVALGAGRAVVVEAPGELRVAADHVRRLDRDPGQRVVGAAARPGGLRDRHVHVAVLGVVEERRPRAAPGG